MTRAFREAQEYIEGIPKFVKKNTMEDTRAFYRKLSCPCEDSKVIHVAGTNGKGSVCAYLQSVLMQAGYKTGMFISPHLVDIRERIRVDGALISEEDFVTVFRQVREACGKDDRRVRNGESSGSAGRDKNDGSVRNGGNDGQEIVGRGIGIYRTTDADCGREKAEGYHPSYFEYLYFMAMLYFEKEKPDVIILETGLGGRLDATNSFPSPCISIITGISMDHTEYLGETLEEIAAEKAGIVKKGIPLVYFANNKKAAAVIEKSVKRAESVAFSVKPGEICLEKYDEKGIDFSYYSGYYKYSTFHLATKALYQMENAALSVRTLAVLGEQRKVDVTAEDLRRGLERTHWEGRMEEILPGIWLDGAHNPDGIRAFLESVGAHGVCGADMTAAFSEGIGAREACGRDMTAVFSEGRGTDETETGRILLYSALAEKACGEMAGQIAKAGLFEEIIVTRIESPRAAEAGELAALFGEDKAMVIEDLGEAFGYCLRRRAAGKRVYITGSLYLAGQVMALAGGAGNPAEQGRF